MTDTPTDAAIDVDTLEKTYAGDVHAVRGPGS